MSDENQAQVEKQEQGNTETPDKKTELDEAIKNATDSLKKEIAGLNRRNSQLEDELKEKAREKMSADELAEAKRHEAEEELKRLSAEKEALIKDRIVDKYLFESGLPFDLFGARIQGKTEAEIQADIKKLKEFFDTHVAAGVEAETQKRFAGKGPAGSVSKNPDTLQTQYDQAKTKGDAASMIAIKRAAQREGVEIH
jgi:DNA repair exonuclease SbcCD ATPase subunit